MRRAARNPISPFRAGFDARMAGKSPNDCPYSPAIVDIVVQVQRQEWQLGYAAADQQLEREGKKG